MKKIIPIIIIVIIIVSNIQAEILNVPSEYTTIQSAIDNAAPSDTVLLEPGIYEENVSVIGLPLTLAGFFILGDEYSETPEQTIIDGINLEFNEQALLHITHSLEDTFRIKGLSFNNSLNINEQAFTLGAAIYADTSLLNIENCFFNSNSSMHGAAIYVEACETRINYCYFENNIAYGGGAIKHHYDSLFVDNSTFFANHSISGGFGGGAISTDNGTNGFIRNSIFTGNTASHAGGAIYIKHGQFKICNNLFDGNSIEVSGGAITTGWCDSLIISNNIFINNLADDGGVSAWGSAIFSFDSQPPTIIEKNSFFCNYAVGSGTVYNSADSTLFRNNMFVANKGNHGGGILTIDVNSVIPDVYYSNNAVKFTQLDSLYILSYRAAIETASNSQAFFSDNDIIGNSICAAITTPGGTADLENNYWGHESGPMHPTQNPDGLGDVVDEDVDIIPFATEPFWEYGLEFDTDTFDFGYVPPGDSATHNFTMTNVTNEDLQIFKLLITLDSPGFSVPAMDSLYIISGESICVPVTFRPEVEANYYNILSTLAYDHLASGSTIELLGSGIDTGVENENTFIPTEFQLSNPSPNPFNSLTNLKVFLPRPGILRTCIYDINGREVLNFGEVYLNRGEIVIPVDLSSQSSSIYFLTVVYENHQYTKKLLLIK